MNDWKLIFAEVVNNLWDLCIQADAVYECPKDQQGNRLGPLVPYAGKDEKGRNLVGDVYFNYARIEEQPRLLLYFATKLSVELEHRRWERELHCATIVGIPDGGRTLGQALSQISDRRFVYPAKIPRPKAPGATKDEFDFVFKRSELSEGERVIVCDDVFNNFQNTDETLEAIGKTGAVVVALCCGLNRSPFVENVYTPKKGKFAGIEIPVFSAMRRKIPEYNQDDVAVASDIAKGNIEPKVKDNWKRLRKIMEEAGK